MYEYALRFSPDTGGINAPCEGETQTQKKINDTRAHLELHDNNIRSTTTTQLLMRASEWKTRSGSEDEWVLGGCEHVQAGRESTAAAPLTISVDISLNNTLASVESL